TSNSLQKSAPDCSGARYIFTMRDYFATWPVRPSFCKAAMASFSLKSPVMVKDVAPLAAVLPVTPETEPSALFTAFTQEPQQRCTPSTVKVLTFSSVAPVAALTEMAGLLLLP